MRMHGLCTMHNVHNDHNALEATCRYTTNASYTLIHHVSMQFNQAKCLSMHEHVLEDARCMSLWLECKENASVCMLCMTILTPTPITLQNPTQIKEFKSMSSKPRIYIEFACNFIVQFHCSISRKAESSKQ